MLAFGMIHLHGTYVSAPIIANNRPRPQILVVMKACSACVFGSSVINHDMYTANNMRTSTQASRNESAVQHHHFDTAYDVQNATKL